MSVSILQFFTWVHLLKKMLGTRGSLFTLNNTLSFTIYNIAIHLFIEKKRKKTNHIRMVRRNSNQKESVICQGVGLY